MGYGMDEEDVGGFLAEQDSFTEDCEKYEGNCRWCPNEYTCQSSDYNRRRIERWQ